MMVFPAGMDAGRHFSTAGRPCLKKMPLNNEWHLGELAVRWPGCTCYLDFRFRSAQRSFIISEMRLRARRSYAGAGG